MKGIYVHIPFCARKCKYCDFASYAGKMRLADAYIDALEDEARIYRGTEADTVFVGGGTPSLLSAERIKRVCKICFENFNIADNYEFTMEINPGTIDDDKIRAMLSGGVNRASVGVQSFCGAELNAIGRIHDAETAYNTVYALSKNGFSNINIDLMTGLPSQSMESLKETLTVAVNLPVTHISAYSLIIEDGTEMEREYSSGEIILPDEDTDREMYAYTSDFLAKHGFSRYEISNFAKEGFECAHNIKYWTGEEYIGLGAAAHSYDGNARYSNSIGIEEYISDNKRDVIYLSEKDKISEFMITGLRMEKGISADDFYRLFGKNIEDIFGNELNKFINMNLIRYKNGLYSLTPRGIDVSNSVLCEFV